MQTRQHNDNPDFKEAIAVSMNLNKLSVAVGQNNLAHTQNDNWANRIYWTQKR